MVFTHVTGLCITVVIALLHVTEIRHRITRYKSAMKHRLLHMLRRMCISRCYALSGGLLMEASPTCFCALLTGMQSAFSDTRCNSIWCTPQQLLSQLLPLLLSAQKQTTLNQSVLFQNSLSQGLTVSQRSPVTPRSLRRLRACSSPGKTGDTAVCQTCARSVRHPVTAAEAAW